MEGKYFWLKLKRDFFKRHDIRIIEAMPDGKEYVLFYLKLLVESIDHEGNLRFSDNVAYTPEMLATITGTDPKIASEAMDTLINLGMINTLDDGTYVIKDVQAMIGVSEADEHTRESTRLRVKAYRERKKDELKEDVTECNADVTLQKRYSNVTVTLPKRDSNVTCNGEIEKEIEKEIELDKEKENNKCVDNNNSIAKEREDADLALAHLPVPKPYEPRYPEATPYQKQKYGEYQHVMLSQNDFQKLVSEHGMDMVSECIQFFDEYIEQKGYKNNNHYLAINKWVVDAVNERRKKKKGSLGFENERKTDYMKLFGQGG